jgi:hypothetical protein
MLSWVPDLVFDCRLSIECSSYTTCKRLEPVKALTAFGKLTKANNNFDHLYELAVTGMVVDLTRYRCRTARQISGILKTVCFELLKRQSLARCKQVRRYQHSSSFDSTARQSSRSMSRARRRRRVRLSSWCVWVASWVGGCCRV